MQRRGPHGQGRADITKGSLEGLVTGAWGWRDAQLPVEELSMHAVPSMSTFGNSPAGEIMWPLRKHLLRQKLQLVSLPPSDSLCCFNILALILQGRMNES